MRVFSIDHQFFVIDVMPVLKYDVSPNIFFLYERKIRLHEYIGYRIQYKVFHRMLKHHERPGTGAACSPLASHYIVTLLQPSWISRAIMHEVSQAFEIYN